MFMGRYGNLALDGGILMSLPNPLRDNSEHPNTLCDYLFTSHEDPGLKEPGPGG